MTENPSLQPSKGVFVFNTGHWRLPSPITWLAGEGKAQRQNSLQAGWPVTSQRWSQSDFSPWSRSLLLGPKWIHSPQNRLLATSVAKGVLHWGQRAVPHWGQRGVLHWGQWGSALRTMRGSALRTKSSSALRTKRGSALRTMGFCTEDKEGFCTEDKEGFCTEDKEGFCTEDKEGFCTEDKEGFHAEDKEGFHTEDKAPPPTVTSPQTSMKLLKWFAVSPESSVVPLYRLCKPHLCCFTLQTVQTSPLLSHFTDCANSLTSVVPLYRLCKQPPLCCPTLQTVQTASPLLSHFTYCANNLTSVVPLYRLCKPHLCCSTLQTVQTSPLLSHFTDCANSLTSIVPLYRLCKQPHLCCPTLQTVQTASPLLSHFTDCANLTSVVPLYRLCKQPHLCCPTLQTVQTSPLLSSALSMFVQYTTGRTLPRHQGEGWQFTGCGLVAISENGGCWSKNRPPVKMSPKGRPCVGQCSFLWAGHSLLLSTGLVANCSHRHPVTLPNHNDTGWQLQ